MHCASNYPAKKSKSDIDIELKDNMEDIEYLDVLHKNLKILNQNFYDFVFMLLVLIFTLKIDWVNSRFLMKE